MRRQVVAAVVLAAALGVGSAHAAEPAQNQITPGWKFDENSGVLTYGAPKTSWPWMRWTCDGDAVLVRSAHGPSSVGALDATRRFDSHGEERFASGPIVRAYDVHQVWDGEPAQPQPEADVSLSAADPMTREFARSGRLYVGMFDGAVDAETDAERNAIRGFFERCRARPDAQGRLQPRPYADGEFAYPFTPEVMKALPVAAFLAGALALLAGRRGAAVGLLAGVAAAATYAANTAGPFAATTQDAWVFRFNEVWTPITAALGPLASTWLVVGGLAAVAGLLVRAVALLALRARKPGLRRPLRLER